MSYLTRYPPKALLLALGLIFSVVDGLSLLAQMRTETV